jgi:hypothetical protein
MVSRRPSPMCSHLPCGSGLIVVRMDSAYYVAKVIAAIGRAGERFSVTIPMDPKVQAAIAAIPEDAWTLIKGLRAIWDDQLRAWISDAGVAEVPYTAFTSKKGQAVTARLTALDHGESWLDGVIAGLADEALVPGGGIRPGRRR